MAIGKNFIYLVVVLIYLKISVPSMNANYDADKGKEKAKSLNPSSCIIVPAAPVTDCGSPSLGVSLGQWFHLPVLHLMSRSLDGRIFAGLIMKEFGKNLCTREFSWGEFGKNYLPLWLYFGLD
ncbi:Uncharacterized protein Fot_17230 [Forsythia ovata]|uniref:Uncharacterized protein n=1 Tax=Forsythia ovata TaxID=205694 RepID=A0ABD1VES6_9LAMI